MVWGRGGDVFAAAQIYNMLKDYGGNITVKIDSIAASAASVIAMAGNRVCMSPVAMMMIHNPATVAMGDTKEMEKAIDMLNEVKESIINAYENKSHLSRNKIAKLMDQESWFNAKKAVELGFADEILFNKGKEDEEDKDIRIGEEDDESEEEEDDDDKKDEDGDEEKKKNNLEAIMFQRKSVTNSFFNKVADETKGKTPIAQLEKRLNLLKP